MSHSVSTWSPNTLWWVLTSDCNLSCLHCYLNTSKYTWPVLSEKRWDNVLDQAAEAGIKMIFLTGGEPFLLNIERLYKLSKDHNITIIGIETNGAILNKTLIDTFLEHNTALYVSYDQFHKNSIGNVSKWNMLVEKNIVYLTDNEVNVYINTVISSDTMNYISDYYERLKSLSISGWRLIAPTRIGGAKDIDILSVDEEANIYGIVMKLWLDDERPFQLTLGSLMTNRRDENNILIYPEYVCQYFRSVVTMMPDGRLLPCCRYIAHPDIMRLSKSIFENEMSYQFKRSVICEIKNLKICDVLRLPENEDCRTCPLLNVCQMGCPINAFMESGYINIREKRHCQLMRGFYSGLFKKYDCVNNHMGE